MHEIKLDLVQMKADLLIGVTKCAQRGLNHSVKWLSELLFALSDVTINTMEIPSLLEDCAGEFEAYLMAKSYFDVKEYDRCAHFTSQCTQPKTRFLYFYSRYLSMEKKKLDMTESISPTPGTDESELVILCREMKDDYHSHKLDGFCLYLYAVILKKLNIVAMATNVFIEAVNAEPILWCAWFELGKIVPDRHKILSMELPEHWMKYLFLGHAYLEQLNNEEALQIYFELYGQGLKNSTYIMAQIAIGHHNRRDLMQAIDFFQQILAVDPFRLDNLDTYSNLLYVKEMKTELADLAHKVVLVDKFRVETCCVIGNYYSLRSDHTKAVLYFRRALKLNPQFLSAWTLMGHEYMEMKNTNAAIRSYRQAVEINSRDYRAWYGLGQTYEILKMHFFCLYYYKQAQHLKPNDSRMIIALGETYEKLGRVENALKCYDHACAVGDIEGQALLKLAKLYDKTKMFDRAAAAFTQFCSKEDESKMRYDEEQNEYYSAFQYLANYHLKNGALEEAYNFAYKCIENDKTKEVGRALLKDIASRRVELQNEAEVISHQMAETVGNILVADEDEANMDISETSTKYC